jgi:hypothetical protein
VPGLLEAAQHHDLHQAADVQRWRGRIEADIAGHDLLRRQGVESLGIGQLVKIATLVEQAEQGRSIGHACFSGFGRAPSMRRET